MQTSDIEGAFTLMRPAKTSASRDSRFSEFRAIGKWSATGLLVATLASPSLAQGPAGPRPMPLPPTEQQQMLLRQRMLEQQEVRLPLPIFAKVIGPGVSKAVFFTVGAKAVAIDSPASVGLRARHRYLFAIEGVAEFPGERFYGGIEVLRGPCLPRGVKAADVPIPIRFSLDDLQAVARGGMVTKFLVVEDAEKSMVDFATADEPARYETALDEADAIRMAKDLGKVAMVVRLGTRVPTVGELTAEAVPGSLLVPPSALNQGAPIGQAGQATAFVYADSGTVIPVGHKEGYKSGQSHSFPPSANCASAGGCSDAGCNNRCEACFLPELRAPLDECIFGPYVCDGGDRKPKVTFGQGAALVNIDPEDTIAVYRTKNGPRKIVESNRVCVYAPKYAEVRIVQAPEGYAVDLGARRVDKDVMLLANSQTVGDRAKMQVVKPAGVIARKRPSVFEGEQWAGNFYEVRVLAGFEAGLGWAQEIGLVGPGMVRNTDRAVLIKRVEFAQLLTNVQMPQLVGSIAGASELYRIKGVAELVRVEENPGKPKVQLEKFASTASAKIGETVRFSIKFTNVGKVTVNDVSIVDSLHARLEYVANSAEGPVDSVFTAQENEVGSMTLRWQLKHPLEPGQVGAVSFVAKLR